MELLQLKYYKAVVEAGSINAAAKKLRMTQPPVSMQIRLLENELGCTLFHRGSRKIELTEEGKIFYEHAVHILNMTESAGAAVSDCHSAVSGTLRIGIVSSLAELSVAKWFKGFAEEHPNINYELSEGSTCQLLEKLKSREIDVALIRQPFSARNFEYVSLKPQNLIVIGVDKYITKLSEPVSLEQLSALPLIIYRRWMKVLDQAFAAKGLFPRIICVADDARTCIAWATAGLGVAIAPMDIWQSQSTSELSMRIIEGLAPTAQTTLATNAGGCDTAVGKSFTEYFKKVRNCNNL